MDILESQIKSYLDPLLGFAMERAHTRGYINLLTTFGTREAHRSLTVRYILVDAYTSYYCLPKNLEQIGGHYINTAHGNEVPVEDG